MPDIRFPNMYRVDLEKGPAIKQLHQMFMGDKAANRIGAYLFQGDASVSPGGSCSGTAILNDGSTVALTGTVAGNEIYIDLPPGCYSVPGPIQVYVLWTNGTVMTTVVAGFGTVTRTETGTIIDPGTIIPSVAALIAQIENAVESIPADYSALLASIAPVFSTSQDYAAGNYVWYNGTLYRFTANHAAGSWTGTDAAAAVIGNDLTDLKSAIKKMGNPQFTKTPGYYYSNGTIKSATANKEIYTSKIPVVAGETVIHIRCKFSSAVAQWLVMCTYNASETFKERVDLINNITAKEQDIDVAIMDSDVSYVAFSWRTYNEDAVTVFVEPTLETDGLNDKFNTREIITSVNSALGFANYTLKPFYIGDNGSYKYTSAPDRAVSTNMIPVTPGVTSFSIDCKFPSPVSQWLQMAQFQSDGTFIRRDARIKNITAAEQHVDIAVTNTLTAYVVFSWRTYGEVNPVTITELPNDYSTQQSNINGIIAIKPVDKFRDAAGLCIYDLYEGYIASNCTISSATENEEVYTGFIPVVPMETSFDISIDFPENVAQWVMVGRWKSDGTRITRDTLINESTTTSSHQTLRYTVTDVNTGLVAFTWRTYGKSPKVTITARPNNIEKYEQATGSNYVRAINHRGYNTVAPENTLPAYRLSKRMGFKYVETDICFTSDGVAVLLHDGTINRTARNADGTTISGTVSISDITYEEALEYDFGIWKNTAYAGTKIPTFEEFISLCRSLGLHPYIELKSSGSTQALIEGLYPVVKKYGMKNHVTWASFSSTLLEYIKAIDSSANLMLICNEINSTVISAATALKSGNNDVRIDCNYTGVTDETITDAMDAGFDVEIWAPNAASDILNANPYISGITSDRQIANIVLYNANIN